MQLEQAYGLHRTGMRASRQFQATPAGNVDLAVSRPAVHGGFMTDFSVKEKKVSNPERPGTLLGESCFVPMQAGMMESRSSEEEIVRIQRDITRMERFYHCKLLHMEKMEIGAFDW